MECVSANGRHELFFANEILQALNVMPVHFSLELTDKGSASAAVVWNS